MNNSKNSKLVHGVGINDADYPVYVFAEVGGRRKILWRCPIYGAWASMLERCYSAKVQARHPTYAGCTVTPEWLNFSSFRAWMITQPWEGNELDKDILAQGNREYGPHVCVFVSCALNLFMSDRGSARGEFPIGVCWDKRPKKFKARCCNPFNGKQEHLGYFIDPYEAHEAWRAKKHQHACRYADQQTDPRIAQALRVRYHVSNEEQ